MKKSTFLLLITVLVLIGFKANAQEDSNNSSESLQLDDKPIKPFHFSLFPGVSSDGTQSLQYRYQMSLNMFMGMNGGVQGMELGGFMNINRGDVEGLQGAGFMNVVHGTAEGLQASGFMNVVHGDVFGVQGTGFMNVLSGSFEGVQGAGFMNVIRQDLNGLSGSGFTNVIAGDIFGLTGAGFMNVVRGNADGAMLAGFSNACNGDAKGVLLAGFGNFIRGNVQGPQGAGFINVAKNIQGVQAAGFINIAKEVDGMQLGFINVSDTITGLPIGFLSIVKNGGIRQFELSASDAVAGAVSFKIGVPAFYNIFSLGYNPLSENARWASGYGMGTHIALSENAGIQIEGHSYQFYGEDRWWEVYNLNRLNEARFMYFSNISSHFQWFAGPVIYNHVFKESRLHSIEDLEMAPYTIFDHSNRYYTSQYWVGARAGVRLVIR